MLVFYRIFCFGILGRVVNVRCYGNTGELSSFAEDRDTGNIKSYTLKQDDGDTGNTLLLYYYTIKTVSIREMREGRAGSRIKLTPPAHSS